MPAHVNRLLVGDIGGTKTRLAIAGVDGNRVRIERETDYPSRSVVAFEAVLEDFLKASPVPACAAFGIAGPVRGRKVRATTLPWYIEADALQQRFGFRHCVLLNDLEAIAHGLPALGEDDL